MLRSVLSVIYFLLLIRSFVMTKSTPHCSIVIDSDCTGEKCSAIFQLRLLSFSQMSLQDGQIILLKQVISKLKLEDKKSMASAVIVFNSATREQ